MVKVYHRAGTRLWGRSQIPLVDPVPIPFETTKSQELTWDLHILSTGRVEWGRAQVKSTSYPKTEGKLLPAWDAVS